MPKFECRCGERDLNKFYSTQLYRCIVCVKRINQARHQGLVKKCRCGEDRPEMFHPNHRNICLACERARPRPQKEKRTVEGPVVLKLLGAW